MKRQHSTRRRSAAQWAKLLKGWDRKTRTAEQFAASLDVSPGTVAWWCWRLKHEPVASAPKDELRFVQVAVEPDPIADSATGWELTTASGHTLRVHGTVAPEVLRVVLDHLAPRSAR